MKKKITLDIEVTEEQAEAVAQVLKRIGFTDIRKLSETEADTYEAQYALEEIRKALSNQGYNPR